MKLYHYWRSSCSWRVRWALQLKKIPHELIAVDLVKGEQYGADYHSMSPMDQVPSLKIEGGPVLSESLAILDWLESHQPQPNIFPHAPLERAQALRLAHVVNSGTQPLQNFRVQQMIAGTHADRVIQGNESDKIPWTQYWIHRGLSAYEEIARETAGTYSVGSQISIADLCLIPQVYNALRFDIDIQEFPTINRINQAALLTPECQASTPEHSR